MQINIAATKTENWTQVKLSNVWQYALFSLMFKVIEILNHLIPVCMV